MHFGIEAGSLAEIRALCSRTPGLRRLWIIGSRARGDHRPQSDIDLVADAPDWTLLDSLAFDEELGRLPMVYPVDCAWWQDTALSDAFRTRVARDRQVLWAAQATSGALS